MLDEVIHCYVISDVVVVFPAFLFLFQSFARGVVARKALECLHIPHKILVMSLQKKIRETIIFRKTLQDSH
jgi:hypothetical protein